ncbi:MAG TPA: 2-alkenal reductase, partial [Roseateles sp.]
MLKQLWLIFAQAVTVALAALFVVATLKPQWLHQARWREPAIAQTAQQIALPPSPPASVVRAGFAQAARAA